MTGSKRLALLVAVLCAFGCSSDELLDAIAAARETQTELAANIETVRGQVAAVDAENREDLLEVLDAAKSINARTAGVVGPLASAAERDGFGDFGALLSAAGQGASVIPGWGPLAFLALTSAGGFLTALKQRKAARVNAGEIEQLAGVLVRAAKVGAGSINTDDKATKAILSGMGPKASAAIARAKGA
jgi:hypothetical protein